MNENNIVNMIVNDDKSEIKRGFMDTVNYFYDSYLSTLNNEEKGYLNNEDERACAPVSLLYPSEIGVRIDENVLLYFGTCKRTLFLKLKGCIKDEDKNFDEVASIERIDLVKEQWVRKFKLANVYKEYKNLDSEYKNLGGIKLSANCEGYVFDPSIGSEMALLIKPIEHNFITKDSVFGSDGKPMMEHLGEALSVALANKLKVKLLYVGKNKAQQFKEFNIGSDAGVITINGVKNEKINLKSIFTEFSVIKTMFEIDKVPPRDYGRPGSLSQEQVDLLKQNKIIQEKDAWKYLNGKELFKPFRCEVCKYKSKCDTLPDGWADYE